MRLLKALDRNRRVTVIPYQKPGVAEEFGLTLEECKAAAWTLTPDGRRHRGAGAINMVLAVALGINLPHTFYRLSLVRRTQDFAYDWVAANRSRLPGDEPYCSQHPDQC